MFRKVYSAGIWGIDGFLVSVEADVHNGLPGFQMTGNLSQETREAQERVRIALKNGNFFMPPKKVTVNLSPAGRCGAYRRAGAERGSKAGKRRIVIGSGGQGGGTWQVFPSQGKRQGGKHDRRGRSHPGYEHPGIGGYAAKPGKGETYRKAALGEIRKRFSRFGGSGFFGIKRPGSSSPGYGSGRGWTA